jgi:hypothetical protein
MGSFGGHFGGRFDIRAVIQELVQPARAILRHGLVHLTVSIDTIEYKTNIIINSIIIPIKSFIFNIIHNDPLKVTVNTHHFNIKSSPLNNIRIKSRLETLKLKR